MNHIRHLSVRLPWHDGGWNGKVCFNPKANVYCADYNHIREKKDPAFEDSKKGLHLSEFKESQSPPQPPCHGEICAFAEKGYPITFSHPLSVLKIPGYVNLSECVVEFDPYSVFPAPYRWMQVNEYDKLRRDNEFDLRDLEQNDLYYKNSKPWKYKNQKNIRKPRVWIDDPRLQKQVLDLFWDQLEERKSLVLFYTNSAPVTDQKRIIVGVGRLKQKQKMVDHGNTDERQDTQYAWQRQIVHNYPEEGFRLPYQEYLSQGLDVSRIVLSAPVSYQDEFKYVAEHVSDGGILAVLEQLVLILNTIQMDIEEGRFQSTEDWSRHQRWLESAISELWTSRGPYPGLGAVLHVLGFTRSMSYQRKILSGIDGDIAEHVIDILDGKKSPETEYSSDFNTTQRKWKAYSQNSGYRELLIALMRIELTVKQAERIINRDRRKDAGIDFSEEELANNLYLIPENDNGEMNNKGEIVSDPISLETIDQAMCPLTAAPWKIPFDDNRRVRAIMIESLRTVAEEGDTLLSVSEVLSQVRDRFPGERSCQPDPFLILSEKDFFAERIIFKGEKDDFVALKEIAQDEEIIRRVITDCVGDQLSEEEPDWEKIIVERFGHASSSNLDHEVELAARKEKKECLQRIFKNKFSVLTGRAGTGKTTLLQLFLKGLLERGEKPGDVLVLAPTGKARVRINANLKIPGLSAQTMHQHLNKTNWLNARMQFQKQGGNVTSARTIVLDESSMIAEDLLAAFFRSIEWSQVERLIMVGDPNQLPPIGPGRPFDDIIKWLDSKHPGHHADLKQRVRQKARESLCLDLADGFLRNFKPKNIEEVYHKLRENTNNDADLILCEWDDEDSLLSALDKAMGTIGVTDLNSYAQSVGIADNDYSKCESWQILSPTKHKRSSGTLRLNDYLQRKFLGEEIAKWRSRSKFDSWRRYPSPFGKTKDIIHNDKVIQGRNITTLRCWPDKAEKYVANGEIGIVRWHYKMPSAMNVTFSDQPEHRYQYYNGEGEHSVELNLELAYAITVHKSQGSDFKTVILVIPADAFNMSMEMMYTALTRFKEKTIILVEGGTETLQKYRQANQAETGKRNTDLFTIVVRDDVSNIPYAENRIHRTKNGFMVRSKSEVIVANELISMGIPLTEENYERRLSAKDNPRDYRLPDFTVKGKDGKEYYWEHLGMLSVESYRKGWEKKKRWYVKNGYEDRLITSQDGEDGSIDSRTISSIIKDKLL